MHGFQGFFRDINTKENILYPSNVSSNSFASTTAFKLTDELSFAIKDTAHLANIDVFLVTIPASVGGNSHGYIHYTFTDVRSDTGSGGVTDYLYEYHQAAGGFTFNSISGFAGGSSHTAPTCVSVSATQFKVNITFGGLEHLRVTGYCKVIAGLTQDGDLGMQLTYTGPNYV